MDDGELVLSFALTYRLPDGRVGVLQGSRRSQFGDDAKFRTGRFMGMANTFLEDAAADFARDGAYIGADERMTPLRVVAEGAAKHRFEADDGRTAG